MFAIAVFTLDLDSDFLDALDFLLRPKELCDDGLSYSWVGAYPGILFSFVCLIFNFSL